MIIYYSSHRKQIDSKTKIIQQEIYIGFSHEVKQLSLVRWVIYSCFSGQPESEPFKNLRHGVWWMCLQHLPWVVVTHRRTQRWSLWRWRLTLPVFPDTSKPVLREQPTRCVYIVNIHQNSFAALGASLLEHRLPEAFTALTGSKGSLWSCLI